jgi:hypothetical protein
MHNKLKTLTKLWFKFLLSKQDKKFIFNLNPLVEERKQENKFLSSGNYYYL